MKYFGRILFLLLLTLGLTCAGACAEDFGFLEEVLFAQTEEEVFTVAAAHGIALEKTSEQAFGYVCEGISIGGIAAAQADVYTTGDGAMTLPLVYFRIPQEEVGSARTAAPGETHDALLAALSDRYGAPYVTAVTLVSHDSIWFFDGVIVCFSYARMPAGEPYLSLGYVRNIADVGDPAIIGFKPETEAAETAEVLIPAGAEYIDRLTAAAEAAGKAFEPLLVALDMGEYVFLQTEYGDANLNVILDGRTGRIHGISIPLDGSAEAALAMGAVFWTQQGLQGAENPESLVSVGEYILRQIYDELSKGHRIVRDGTFCYSLSYDRNKECEALMISTRGSLAAAGADSTLEIFMPEVSAPETAVPEMPVSEAAVSDAFVPRAFVSEESEAEAIVSEALATETPVPAEPVPETAIFETPVSEALKPETALTSDEIESWAIGCSVILAEVNGYPFDPYLFGGTGNTEERAAFMRTFLAQTWQCNGREDLIASIERTAGYIHNNRFAEEYASLSALTAAEYEKMLAEASEQDRRHLAQVKAIGDKWGSKQIKAWDCFRAAHLPGWGYIAGYVSLAEAHMYLQRIIELLRVEFSSWDEAVDNYLDGYAWWAGADMSAEVTQYTWRKSIYEKLRDDPRLFNPKLWNAGAEEGIPTGSVLTFLFEDNGDGTCIIIGCEGTGDGSLTLPQELDSLTVTAVGEGAFEGCAEFSGALIIPDGVTAIGDKAFAFCSGITSAVIPGSVASIGKMAFWECRDITDVILLDGVEGIGAMAFCDGHSLRSVTIPGSVADIDASAFEASHEVILRVTEGSYAEQFAKDHGLEYTFIR